MRTAIISDIHGNDCALSAVLGDAEANHVDRYLFLGDYCSDVPMPNDVSRRIFALPDAMFIRGNKEDYLAGIDADESDEWKTKQWAVLRFNFETLKKEFLQAYLNMPERLAAPVGSGMLHATHSAYDFFGNSVADRLRTGQFCEEMRRRPFTHEELLIRIQRDLEAEGHDLRPGGVYAFGHTHVQWHANVNGALLINPGSCGLPLDMDRRAAYTILDDPEDGTLPAVMERRVPYNVDAAKEAILKSPSFNEDSRIWYSIIMLELTSGEEHVHFFVKALNKASGPPYPDEVWTEVGEAFLRKYL